MYAERFKVRSWLEEPSRWLSWAIDASGNVKDAAWNLQQFWKALEPLKTGNRSSQQWGEILLLDSRGQTTLGHHLLLKAALQARSAAVYAVDAAWLRSFSLGAVGVFNALPKVREFLAKNDPGLTGYQASIRRLYDQAQNAFRLADEMATKSKAALTAAKADTVMAERALSVARTGQVITRNDRGQTEQLLIDTATNAGPQLDIPKLITMPIAGIPLWLWAAAGVAVALAISSGPTVVAVSSARKAAA